MEASGANLGVAHLSDKSLIYVTVYSPTMESHSFPSMSIDILPIKS